MNKTERLVMIPFVAVALALAGAPAIAQSNVFPGEAQGSGQIAQLRTTFPATLQVSVVSGTGQTLSGIPVQFYVQPCATGSDPCPPVSGYPTFADGTYAYAAVSDENGIATTSALIAGDTEGWFSVVATVGNGPSQRFFLLQRAELTAVPITSGFTGTWYDPAQSGHGLMFEILPEDRFMAYWFTFDRAGNQQWFGGVGSILNDQAVAYVNRAQDGEWIPNFDPTLVTLPAWGTLTLTFSDCNSGRVDFVEELGSSSWNTGSMPLSRLTLPAGLACATTAP